MFPGKSQGNIASNSSSRGVGSKGWEALSVNIGEKVFLPEHGDTTVVLDNLTTLGVVAILEIMEVEITVATAAYEAAHSTEVLNSSYESVPSPPFIN